MSFIYNIGINIYASALRLAALRNEKAALMTAGHRETWHKLASQIDATDSYIWFHAASLGEFEQGRPLIERLRREHPSLKILLTFFSPSGYEVRKDYAGADIVAYLPFDTPGNVSRFLNLVHPRMAVFVKYEFWYNYLSELKRRGVPTYLISAIFRPSQLFFKSHGGWYRKLLHCFSHLYVQNKESCELLCGVGVKRVTIAGDTRFDRVTDIMQTTVEIPELAKFKQGGGLTFIVGSSWPQDEDVYMRWLNNHKEVKVIVAPHEFNAERLMRLKKRFEGGAVLLSEIRAGVNVEDTQALIIDCFGLLSSAYRYADIAYVGGGFGAGIHNINEAAVYGMPVVFGPKYDKFLEAVELIAAEGGFSIASADDFSELMSRFISDKSFLARSGMAAEKYIKSKLGATDIIYQDLLSSL